MTGVRHSVDTAFLGTHVRKARQTREEIYYTGLTFRREASHDVVNAKTGVGPLSLREIARRVGRDVEVVHADVHALLETGVLERTAEGAIVFPYDAVHAACWMTFAATNTRSWIAGHCSNTIFWAEAKNQNSAQGRARMLMPTWPTMASGYGCWPKLALVQGRRN